MYKSATYDEPLLNELVISKKEKKNLYTKLPDSLQRKKNIDIPDLDETQIVRHFHRLSQMNYGIDSGIYPLGSCTMKYNPKICEEIASWKDLQGPIHVRIFQQFREIFKSCLNWKECFVK